MIYKQTPHSVSVWHTQCLSVADSAEMQDGAGVMVAQCDENSNNFKRMRHSLTRGDVNEADGYSRSACGESGPAAVCRRGCGAARLAARGSADRTAGLA